MFRSDRKGQRLVAVFLLGMLLFNYPAARARSTARPTCSAFRFVYAYIFSSWALLIALMALVIERSR